MPRAKSSQKADRKAGTKAGTLVPQKHGGAIWKGTPETIVPGPGRPPEAIRAAMRELGAAKGVPFLSDVLDGKIAVDFVGTCPHCKEESKPSALELVGIMDAIRASVDQRLKANEQALKYGLGTKDEMSVVSPDVQARVAQTVQVVSDTLPPEYAEPLLAKLSEVWR